MNSWGPSGIRKPACMEALRTLRAVPGVIAPVRLSLILLACGGTRYIWIRLIYAIYLYCAGRRRPGPGPILHEEEGSEKYILVLTQNHSGN